jgi:arylformamidase
MYRDFEDVQTLEREYSPSSCIANLPELLQAYAGRSAQARKANPGMQTLYYGTQSVEAIDYFPAGGRHKPPLLIFIHGGYWQELSKEDASFPATDCTRNGVAYAAVNYGVAPQATMAQMVARCRAAIGALYGRSESLGFDPTRIYVSGSSAGAHLAAMSLLTNWALRGLPPDIIKGAVLLSGIYDLEPIVQTYVNAPLHLDSASARMLSPLFELQGTVTSPPPTLLAYGQIETAEFKRQSVEFSDALASRGGHTQLLNIEGRNHFDIPFDLADERTELGRAVLALIQCPRWHNEGTS